MLQVGVWENCRGGEEQERMKMLAILVDQTLRWAQCARKGRHDRIDIGAFPLGIS